MINFLFQNIGSISTKWDSARLAEKYHIQKVKLGEGSFGTVWRAIDRKTNVAVALKSVEKDKMKKRGVQPEDMAREINMLYKSRGCQYITELRDSFEDGEAHYLALEYCEGGDFGDKLRERRDALEEYEACHYMRMILLAIEFLHDKTILHRDIKPDNFMLSDHTLGARLKLSDFGLAIQLPARDAVLKDKCGTPAFMSPEQHELPRSRGYSFPADLFAAGTCLWCVLHGGDHPFMIGNSLDLPGLLRGQPQFRGNTSFWASSKWSEGAQRLCDQLTARESSTRPSVKKALQDSWFDTWDKKIKENIISNSRKISTGNPKNSPPGSSSLTSGGLYHQSEQVGGSSSSQLYSHSQSNSRNGSKQVANYAGKNASASDLSNAGQNLGGGAGGGAAVNYTSGAGAGAVASSPAMSNTEARAIRDKNRELQAKIEEIEQKEALEKARLAEQIRQLEAQVESGQARASGMGDPATGGGGLFGSNDAVDLGAQEKQQARSSGFGLFPNFFNQMFENRASGGLISNAGPDGAAANAGAGKSLSAAGADENIKGGAAAADLSTGVTGQSLSGRDKYSAGTMLVDGARVCYSSASHNAWFVGTVTGYNADDGTYNLDMKQRAPAERIAPPFARDLATAHPWPAGILVNYWSDSTQTVVSAVVQDFNADDLTYDLDVRKRAAAWKIRIRNPVAGDSDEATQSLERHYRSTAEMMSSSESNNNAGNFHQAARDDDRKNPSSAPPGAGAGGQRQGNNMFGFSQQAAAFDVAGNHASAPAQHRGRLDGAGPVQQTPGDLGGGIVSGANAPASSVAQTVFHRQPTDAFAAQVVGQQGGEVVGRLINPFEQHGGSSSSSRRQSVEDPHAAGAAAVASYYPHAYGSSPPPAETDFNNLLLQQMGAGVGGAGGPGMSPPPGGGSSSGNMIAPSSALKSPPNNFEFGRELQQRQTQYQQAPTTAASGQNHDRITIEQQKFYALSGVLKPGTPCSFRETDYERWQEAVMEAPLPDEHLLIKLQSGMAANTRVKAAPMQVSPVNVRDAWPAIPVGTWVYYHSTTLQTWLPTKISGYADDGSVHLANKPMADRERVRARFRAEADEKQQVEQAVAESQNYNEMKCDICGRTYWSLSGKTTKCPPCRASAG